MPLSTAVHNAATAAYWGDPFFDFLFFLEDTAYSQQLSTRRTRPDLK